MPDPFGLPNRRILVTGASSGIGRECCAAVAAQGGIVIATGRNLERLTETVQSLPGQFHSALPADLTQAEQISELVRQMPDLDGVVHSAGTHKYLPLKHLSDKALREMFVLNYEAPVLLTQRLLAQKLFRSGASIVFLSSLAGLLSAKGNVLYSGAKGALLSSARVMALELAPQAIRVNCVAPGMVRTPLTDQMSAVISPEALANHEKLYPLGFGTSADVANAAVFLLSEASRWITGSTLILDGGFSCQ